MIRAIDCAILSKHVYAPTPNQHYHGVNIFEYSQEKLKYNKNNLAKNGYAMITDVPRSLKPQHAFFAQLYVKFFNGQPKAAIVAFRGTVPTDIKDDYVDIVTWYSDVFGEGRADNRPPYLPITMGYYQKAYRYVREYFPSLFHSQVYLTGHSLGGALAQLVVMNGRAHHACVFNSPGVGHIPGANLRDAPYILNINSKYGVINKIGQTLGTLRYVDVPEDEKAAEALFKGFLLKDYATGKADFAAAEQAPLLKKIDLDAAGLHEDLLAFLGSEKALANHQKPQNPYLNCASDSDKQGWLGLQNLLLPEVCDVLKKLELPIDTGETIAAQHAMSNLLGALLLPKNVSVANINIAQPATR